MKDVSRKVSCTESSKNKGIFTLKESKKVYDCYLDYGCVVDAQIGNEAIRLRPRSGQWLEERRDNDKEK